jgi:hypothetical protein
MCSSDDPSTYDDVVETSVFLYGHVGYLRLGFRNEWTTAISFRCEHLCVQSAWKRTHVVGSVTIGLVWPCIAPTALRLTFTTNVGILRNTNGCNAAADSRNRGHYGGESRRSLNGVTVAGTRKRRLFESWIMRSSYWSLSLMLNGPN